ncbi:MULTISPECIES: methyltransferase domain-containing protein [Streptacidiphilus]|uniref:Methyltransferase domain-containing protein n=1 Tax=Streptacidiphilus cavernicola TaxID=3342716 RepID=A0ABV6UX24_9ACTN|nr:methyltransferase domain-containing protein [Streptacidiphilus jeojiense]
MPTTAEQAKQSAKRKAAIAHGFDLVAEVYGTPDSGGSVHRLGAELVRRARLRPGDRVLDLGCGRGAVLFAAAEAVGPDGYAVGIDLSPAMVQATAAEIAARRWRNLVVRVDDAEDPGFPTGSFEAVLAGLMLFITPDPAAVLSSVHRLLAPGGRFAMSSFGPADPAWDGPVRAALAFAEPQQSVREWTTNKGGNGLLDTPEQIAALLEQAGFGGVEIADEEDTARYRDPEQWWTAIWNSGRRAALLELIPPERREDARKAAFAELESVSGDGGLTRRSTIRYTTATRI